jgi:hypothetical protein
VVKDSIVVKVFPLPKPWLVPCRFSSPFPLSSSCRPWKTASSLSHTHSHTHARTHTHTLVPCDALYDDVTLCMMMMWHCVWWCDTGACMRTYICDDMIVSPLPKPWLVPCRLSSPFLLSSSCSMQALEDSIISLTHSLSLSLTHTRAVWSLLSFSPPHAGLRRQHHQTHVRSHHHT